MTYTGKKSIHFVGIGGIGMSGIANVLIQMGHCVSGSDLESNSITRKIENAGGRIFKGHRSSNVPKEADVVVYSSSISRMNPEMVCARKRKIKLLHRAEMLGDLFNKKMGIAVTGTHGKTTTTSLVSVMLEGLGMDPTVIIGGEVKQFNGNFHFGKGKFLVAEADESDSSFLHLKPFYAILTNLEMEHVDHYGTLEQAKKSFGAFVDCLKRGGTIFYNNDDKNLQDVMKGFNGNAVTFGFSEKSDIIAKKIKMNGFNTSFVCVYKAKELGTVRLKIPGRHNVLNGIAAIALGLNMGLKFDDIVRAIENFDGAKRRFQFRGECGGAMLIDDYAHHPTEIRAALDACRNWRGRNITVIFQPHRYTRTKFLADDFAKCFDGADRLILTDIYAASEKPLKGISIKTIYDKVKRGGVGCVDIMKKEDIARHVMGSRKNNDIILVLGAGDIKQVADELASSFIAEKFKNTVKGKALAAEPMAPHTSLKIGGPAHIWVEPCDEDNLRTALEAAGENGLKVFVIGNGTNILVDDDGIGGVVIRLSSPAFKHISIKGKDVTVGAGFSLPRLIGIACADGLGGLESLVGIPGTVGGAIFMNAGGWTNPIFKNIGDCVESVKVMGYNGDIKVLKRKDIEFGYRRSSLDPYVILEAVLKLSRGDKHKLVSSCTKFLKMKKDKQVLDSPSAGCIFKNPKGSQFTCGQMIDMLGLKGARIGGAEVSRKHANFIINRRGATYKNIMDLIGLIKARVKESYGIDLELEIKVLKLRGLEL